MNTDIRLSTGFWQHPKTKKTVKKLGLEGIQALQVLWLWVAVHRPDGKLSNMDWEDIELASDWQGEERAFFDFCIGDGNSPMWIDTTPDGEFVLHDWVDHNPWQAEADTRSDFARFANLARYNKPMYEILKKQGVKGLTKEEFEYYRSETLPTGIVKDAGTTPNDVVKESYRSPTGVVKDPKPTRPLPLPSPKPEENKNNKQSISGKLKRACEDKVSSEVCCQDSLPKAEEPLHDGFYSEPSGEFQELRAMYDEHARAEAPLAGFIEYKQLRASRQWVGLAVIRDAILKHSTADPERWKKFPVGLARFLRELWWEKVPEPAKGQSTFPPSVAKTPEQKAQEKREAEAFIARKQEESRRENAKLLERKRQEESKQKQGLKLKPPPLPRVPPAVQETEAERKEALARQAYLAQQAEQAKAMNQQARA